MKDGDIYFWRWKDVEKHGGHGEYKAYHCRSQKAIARNGVLYDTFWMDHTHPVRLEDVDLNFKGNINSLDEIRTYEAVCYRPEDIVDMRHSNSSMEKVYVRAGTERDSDIMLEHLRNKIERCESTIRSEQWHIERLNRDIIAVEDGRLDEVIL